MQAGFDLSDIKATAWKEGLRRFNLTEVAKEHPLERLTAWIWYDPETNNRVVTANNPITGEYYSNMRESEKDYVSYVGVEGTEEFVSDFFHWFKKNATYIKGEDFGDRNYI